jgi:hypothetical protein
MASEEQLALRRQMTQQLIIEESRHEALEEMYFWPAVREPLAAGDTLADTATGRSRTPSRCSPSWTGSTPATRVRQPASQVHQGCPRAHRIRGDRGVAGTAYGPCPPAPRTSSAARYTMARALRRHGRIRTCPVGGRAQDGRTRRRRDRQGTRCGDLVHGCLTCPWHGSMFRIADGTVARGPATAFEVREAGGAIQVRLPGGGWPMTLRRRGRGSPAAISPGRPAIHHSRCRRSCSLAGFEGPIPGQMPQT